MAPRSPQGSVHRERSDAGSCIRKAPPGLRHRLVAALVTILGLAPGLAGAQSLKVNYAGGKLSVVAEKVALADVLREVSLRTGIEVLGAQDLGRPVSIDFSGTPLGQAFETLLAGTNYALLGNFTPGPAMRRARVVILTGKPALPMERPAARTAAEAAPAVTLTQAQRNAARTGLMSQNPVEQDAGFRQLAHASPKEILDALEDVLANGDGLARLRALQFLDQDNRIDPAASFGALRNALNDPDPTLRDYAIQALGRREGSESIDLLRQLFNDGDTSVRLSVVESVGQREDARTLLQQATADPDQAVSSLANELLGNTASQPDANPNTNSNASPNVNSDAGSDAGPNR
jgi:HEAT repeats